MLAVSVGSNKRSLLYHIITVFSNSCHILVVGFQRLDVYLSVSVICQVLNVDGLVLLLVIAVVDS